MQTYKHIILGAGPSGLAFAVSLKNSGENSFLVIEKESEAGGLCRSRIVDGNPIDLGGGHFLDIKRKEVIDLLFQYMPRSEWNEFERISKITIRGMEVDYPLEANIWQLPIADQIDFLESIAQAGSVQGLPMPESFEEWISWKLGRHIAEEYMLPYNRKIWSCDLNDLGTYWLYKLPDVSFRQTLQSCLERQYVGSLLAHRKFFYPNKYGYGEIWRRMGEALGEHLLTDTPVTSIDIKNRIINDQYKAEKIVTTIPWTLWSSIAELPKDIIDYISDLHYSSIDINYYPQTLPTKAHWIYEPNEKLDYHRILCRTNFCEGSRGYWTETNSQRLTMKGEWFHRNEYAYPLNTRTKPKAIESIRSWAEANLIYSIGRWGMWEHMNSDVAVSLAIAEAKPALYP